MTLLSWWRKFWFEPSEPFNLGVARALFYLGVLVMYSLEDFSDWANVSSAFWMPMPVFEALGLVPLPSAWLGVAELVWRSALVFSALGLFSRVSMVIAAVLGFYLLGLPHNFGHVYHFDATLVIISIVLAFSRAGDAFSIDARLRGRSTPLPSGEYTWPIRMAWVAIAVVFFAAGIAKFRYGGIEWITSENMSILLTRAVYHVSDGDPITGLGLWVASHPWLASLTAGMAAIIEVGYPLALISRKARLVFVPGAFMMLIGIRVMMGPTFGGFLVANVFWVPWNVVFERVRQRRSRQFTAPRQFGVVSPEERATIAYRSSRIQPQSVPTKSSSAYR